MQSSPSSANRCTINLQASKDSILWETVNTAVDFIENVPRIKSEMNKRLDRWQAQDFFTGYRFRIEMVIPSFH